MDPIRWLSRCFSRFGSSAPPQLPKFPAPKAIDKYVAPGGIASVPKLPEKLRLIWGPISDLARLAPTPHNTQPFRILPWSDTEADVLILPERLLPEEDHGNRYMMMSSGIFAEAMELAGRSRGLVIEVAPIVEVDPERLADGREPVVVARARITGRCDKEPEAGRPLEERKTSRLRYHDRKVSGPVLENLRRIAEAADQRFLPDDDPRVVDDLIRQNAQSVIDNLQLRSETQEVKGWMRYGKTPKEGDGMWERPFGQKKWMTVLALTLPWLFKLPGISWVSKWIYRRTMAGTRHVGLLCGKFDKTPDLFATGRMFLKFWLEMQKHGVVMHPLGSMITNADHRRRIFDYFKVNDCWLAFRFGYSDDPPRAPRLATVLMDKV